MQSYENLILEILGVDTPRKAYNKIKENTQDLLELSDYLIMSLKYKESRTAREGFMLDQAERIFKKLNKEI